MKSAIGVLSLLALVGCSYSPGRSAQEFRDSVNKFLTSPSSYKIAYAAGEQSEGSKKSEITFVYRHGDMDMSGRGGRLVLMAMLDHLQSTAAEKAGISYRGKRIFARQECKFFTSSSGNEYCFDSDLGAPLHLKVSLGEYGTLALTAKKIR